MGWESSRWDKRRKRNCGVQRHSEAYSRAGTWYAGDSQSEVSASTGILHEVVNGQMAETAKYGEVLNLDRA